jgi:quercetin dioxygenase-like cupin family protein
MTTPKNVSDLISFQNGSVVSKEILNKPSGTITLFAFDQNQGLSEHTAPFDAVVLAIEGSAEITVSGTKHQLKIGEMLLMPSGSPHSIKALTPFKMLLTMIKS